MKITDEMLREAAGEAAEVLTQTVQRDYVPGSFVPSPEFQGRMEALLRRSRRPAVPTLLRRAAAAALVLLLGCGSWLALDAEARGAFTGWARGIYEEVAIYHPGNTDHDQHFDYLPGWIPAGYKKLLWYEGASGVTAAYINEQRKILQFGYRYENGVGSILFDTQNMKLSHATVNGDSADLWIAETAGAFPTLIWVDCNNQAFYVSGDLPTEELIRFAESLEQQRTD